MITIYGKQSCSFCKKAVALCEEKNIRHIYIDMDDAEIDRVVLSRALGFQIMTVPQILHMGDYIGGYEDFLKWTEK